MRIIKKIIFCLLCFAIVEVSAQNYYGIKQPGDGSSKKCENCMDVFSSMPEEVHFSVFMDEQDNIYFIVTKKEWYDKIIKHRRDGIAIDIVRKDRYSCSNASVDQSTPVRGSFQKPRYRKRLKKDMIITKDNEVVISMGKLPSEFKGVEIEINFLVIQKKHWCYYWVNLDIERFRWDLLDMGMYFDTLTYKSDFDTCLSQGSNYSVKNKIMRFEIPFKKNKYEYSNADIKPLYDSLRLTDYEIKKITIRSYSSVEGDEEKNISLQQKRSQSIVSALQSFQTAAINTEIILAENWIDFLSDVVLTQHAYLADLSKEEIKEKLNDRKILKELEPLLALHRKAVVVLELEKKDDYKKYSSGELVNLFAKSVAESNIEQAKKIQNSIFEKIKNNISPVNLLDTLQIPDKEDYSILLTKNAVFKYFMDEQELLKVYNDLLVLQDLFPKDGKIKYNICVLKFKIWMLGTNAFNFEEFKQEITELKKYHIPSNLIKRMLVNYEIIMCEYYMQKGEFDNKDKSLKFIASNYKGIPMSDADYLSLAQYYVSYDKYDWAIKLLEKKVVSQTVNEDLLFYYINLTIMDEKITKKGNYKAILLNAINMNKARYCKLFDTKIPGGKGGVSFQLLENPKLRTSYCESCN